MAQETFPISGTVSDEKGMTIPGATVFITNTKHIQSTNNEGSFTFNNIAPGTYEVVVKFLGYSPAVKSVTVTDKPAAVVFKLSESNTILNTVTINAGPDPNHEKYLADFKKYFIGETDNARQCILVNPEVLHFHYDKNSDVLSVTANDFVIVQNKALGYNLKFLLTQFTIDFKNNFCLNSGYPYFEEIKGNEQQQQTWQQNRKVAYLSSPKHFFRAVLNHTTTEEGFTIYQIPFKATHKQLAEIHPLNPDSVFINSGKNFRTIKAKIDKTTASGVSEYYIVYTGEDEGDLFRKTDGVIDIPVKIKSLKRQISKIQTYSDETTVDKNGVLVPSGGLKLSGYWAWEKMADLTPLDYFIEPQGHNEIKDPILRNTLVAIDTARSLLPVEKLYVQLDRPYYNIGDTIQFKSYLFNGDYLTPATRSRLLYIELDDVAGKMVKRMLVPLESGVSWGSIALNANEIGEGSYTIRAYTSWMRNFDADYVFKKNIYVSSVNTSAFVKAGFKLQGTGEKSRMHASLQFIGLNKSTEKNQTMQLKLMDESHNLFKDKFITGTDGTIETDFDISSKLSGKNLFIKAQQTNNGADSTTLIIPVTLNRPENTDLQFMPEGGNLVAGVESKIGFKAISEDGRGITISGKIYNSKQQEVTEFKSQHAGMGSFNLLPQPGESYTAKLNLPQGVIKSFTLPAVNLAGTTLKISDKGNDSVKIQMCLIQNSPVTDAGTRFYLIGQAKGIIYYSALVTFKTPTINNTIDKSVFPTGIIHFTLLNQAGVPVNERIVFIDHHDDLQLNITENKPAFTARDSVALAIAVKNKNGKPVQGNFSIAITDDSQVKTDSLGGNILNNLLLTSDLKGTVEYPGYYFAESTPQQIADRDNLLLTQGWIGYDWKDIFAPKTEPAYPTEAEYTIQGKITDAIGKPIEKTGVVLFSFKPLIAKDTLTSKDGHFTFKGIYPVDTAAFRLQAKNKNDKSFNINIEISNEFKPPVFASNGSVTPWYVNNDVLFKNSANTALREANLQARGRLLKTVIIKNSKIINDSKNLNGAGIADQVLNEQDIEKAGKITLEELLEKKIKGFIYKEA